MQMNQVILERRRALGLTQEQVADALGVTAPAVNKWEKGATCPDIALLAPLARLLEIDLNALLCFHENLTEQEVQRFATEVMQTADRDGLDAGFALAREQLRRYPNSDLLAYTLAAVLQGLISLSAGAAEREAHEEQLTAWYERAAKSGDAGLRARASLMLAGRCIQRKNWDAAQRAIDMLPERQPIDRRVMQAQLCSARGEAQAAAHLLEQVLLAVGQELTSVLPVLTEAELAAGDAEAAAALARASEAAVACLDLWAYMGQTAPLMVAVAKRDVRESVGRLRRLLEEINRPWNPSGSPLYRRIFSGEAQNGAVNARIIAPILRDLKENPEYDFLRGDAEFQALMAAYGACDAQA